MLRIARLGYGAQALLAPAAVLRAGGIEQPSTRSQFVVRLLGARHIAQAWYTRRRTRSRLELGAIADGLHSLSMTALALARPHWRRAAGSDAALAATYCGATALVARRLHSFHANTR
jgi:uncharacterized protein YjiS (DUF1127 family)